MILGQVRQAERIQESEKENNNKRDEQPVVILVGKSLEARKVYFTQNMKCGTFVNTLINT